MPYHKALAAASEQAVVVESVLAIHPLILFGLVLQLDSALTVSSLEYQVHDSETARNQQWNVEMRACLNWLLVMNFTVFRRRTGSVHVAECESLSCQIFIVVLECRATCHTPLEEDRTSVQP